MAGRYDLEMLDHTGWPCSSVRTTSRRDCSRAAKGDGNDCRWRSCWAAIRGRCWRWPRRCRREPTRPRLAGVLREKPLEMVKCRSIELEVPADAEIVLEGYIDRQEAAGQGRPALALPWANWRRRGWSR